jgi:hypothetical protein
MLYDLCINKVINKQHKYMETQTHPKGSGFGGKYTRLPSVMREKLNKALPAESIGRHPSMSFLSTIKSIYVTERLNDVFGSGGWDLETEIVKEERLVHNVKGKDVDYDHVIVCGRLYFREFDLYGPVQFGGHDDKTLMAVNAYKGAITDCLSKCASLLEIGIQVFKGNPDDRTPGNKSKRLDENAPKKVISEEVVDEFLNKESDANLEGMKKPPIEEVVEPIEIEEGKPTEEDLALAAEISKLHSQHKYLFGRKPNANVKIENLRKKVETEQAKRKAEEAEAIEEEFPLDDAEEADADVAEEVIDLKHIKEVVMEYTVADALLKDAKKLDKLAETSDFSPEDRTELRNYINQKYKELNK